MTKQKASNQFFIPHNVLEEVKFIEMSLSAQILYVHLCRLKNRMKKEKFYRDIRTLSKETGLHRNTLTKAKQELSDAKYIGIERDSYRDSGQRSADIFHLNGYRYKAEKDNQ
ncbi:MAG: helix-turn-helix domain-containing protein [Patescibacteria group bacterium]|jgi:hypothetical protein